MRNALVDAQCATTAMAATEKLASARSLSLSREFAYGTVEDGSKYFSEEGRRGRGLINGFGPCDFSIFQAFIDEFSTR